MRLTRFAAVVCAALYIINIPASAGNSEPTSSPDSIAREIALQSPEVAAAKARYDAELEQARAANVLAGPEVEFGYKFNADSGPDKWGVSVGQSFDWPGIYGARREAGRFRAEAFGRLYKAALLERAFEVKQLLVRLAVARCHLNTLHEAAHAEELLSETYSSAFDRGEATLLDVSKIKLEAFETSNLVAEAEASLQGIEATLRAYGADPASIEIPDVTLNAVLKPYDYYRSRMADSDPTIAAASSLAAAAAADVKVARRSAMPSFKIAFTHDYEESTHFNGFSIGFALPTWSRSRAVSSARAGEQAVRMEADDYAMRANARLMSEYTRCVTLNRRVDDARATFASDDYTALLRKALDARRITLYEYLNSCREYYQAKSAYIDLCGELAQGIASLSRYDLIEP